MIAEVRRANRLMADRFCQKFYEREDEKLRIVGGPSGGSEELGALPPDPQDLSLSCQNLVLGFGLGERVGLAPDQIPAPGSALRSHPCVALSSAQANRSVRPERRTYKRPTRIGYKSHQAAKAISRILFHLPCKVAMESSSGKGTGTR